MNDETVFRDGEKSEHAEGTISQSHSGLLSLGVLPHVLFTGVEASKADDFRYRAIPFSRKNRSLSGRYDTRLSRTGVLSVRESYLAGCSK